MSISMIITSIATSRHICIHQKSL